MGFLTSESTHPPTTKQVGDAAERDALLYLQRQGLQLLERNYKTPGRGGGEIDLIMREKDGTYVFVEVRKRASMAHGGAAASVGLRKQQKIVFAARHFLRNYLRFPPCRFDVLVLELGSVQWLKGAFDAT
jgi:putative endonuclease